MLPDGFTVLERTPQQARLALVLQADLPYFQGHFPARSLLPGVAQLDFAMALCNAVLEPGGVFTGVRRVKFLRPMLPGDGLILDLCRRSRDGCVEFVYYIAARAGTVIAQRPGIMASRGCLTCAPLP